MILEERTYTLSTKFTLADYLEPYERIGLPVQSRILGNLVGGFTVEVGQLHSVVHLWGYDSFEERMRRRQELARAPEWAECLEIIRPMIATMENRLLVPTPYSPPLAPSGRA